MGDKAYIKSCNGFTLLEMVVALAVALIGLTAVYIAYQSQQKSYLTQEAVAAMQQNLRVALHFLERDLRMAGCDPSGSAGAGIVAAQSGSLRFTMDVTGGESDGLDNDNDGLVDEPDEFYDGDCLDQGEDITYSLGDPNGSGVNALLRNGVSLAENIDALDFVYLDQDSDVTNVVWRMRFVGVTVVARSSLPGQEHTDAQSYTNQQGTVIFQAPGDNFRRRSMTTLVKLRNLGS